MKKHQYEKDTLIGFVDYLKERDFTLTKTINSKSYNKTDYKGDGEIIGADSTYGFQYNFGAALEDGIYRPSVSPAVFELKNPNQDIYGKVV